MRTRLSRRRFLAITAAAIGGPASATPVTWHGYAMGAGVSLSIHAPKATADRAIVRTRALLRRVETLFSLYDPASRLSELNRSGNLAHPPGTFLDLARICSRMHRATDGIFDPTIQPLWRALALGNSAERAVRAIGWQRVDIGASIRLAPGQAVTFNGIAQGYATDLIRAALAELGLSRALINMGEYAALGGPFRVGLADPGQGLFATRELHDRAIATSSPGAMRLSGASHILHPALVRAPVWSTVSVEARKAAIADAASTAFTLMTANEIRACLPRLPAGTRATLLAQDGSVQVTG